MTPERKNKIERVLSKRQPDMVVLLENVEDRHNISAVMRTCDAVGIQSVYLLNTEIHNHKKFGHKSSGSAALWLNVHQYDNLEECIAAIRKQVSRIYATHLTQEATSLYELDLTEPIAFAFGNERKGISAELLKMCDGNFLIPQAGMIEALNISVACAISLYEAYRQRSVANFYNGETRLPQDDVAAIKKAWKYRD